MDNQGKIVTNPSFIAKRYLQGMFIFDLASTVPFDRIATAILSAQQTPGAEEVDLSSMQMIRAVRLVRLLKLMRMLKLRRMMRSLGEIGISQHMINMVSYFTVLTFLAHLCGGGGTLWWVLVCILRGNLFWFLRRIWGLEMACSFCKGILQ